jgi:hypothetical protein
LYRPGTSDTLFIGSQCLSSATSGPVAFVAPAIKSGYRYVAN